VSLGAKISLLNVEKSWFCAKLLDENRENRISKSDFAIRSFIEKKLNSNLRYIMHKKEKRPNIRRFLVFISKEILHF
jgi:hypothetical protein